jgi:DNA-directed RNA polymerase beta subunit
MPVPSVRYIKANEVRNFGTLPGGFDLSDLTQIQTESYARFLQLDRRPDQRRGQGLEEILREVFPVVSNDGQFRLEYVKATKKRCSKIYQRLRPGNPPQLEKARKRRSVPREVLRREPLSPRSRRSLPHQPQVRPERPR